MNLKTNLLVAAGSLVLVPVAHAGTITAQGNCTAITDFNDMGVLSGMGEFDEGPTVGAVPLDVYSGQGLTFKTGLLTAILPGVTTLGSASQAQYATVLHFPQPIGGNGVAALQNNRYAGVATFDILVTKFGLTASKNGTQWITAWDDAGNMLGQVQWVPAADSAFVGIDCGNAPIKMISYGNDDLWNGGTYGIGGSTIYSDTWVWGGDTNCGNGVLDAGEECDDMNADFTDACTIGCKNASCGDGFVWAGNEACDDGNTDNTDDCVGACTAPVCGDGFVWMGNEDCDDGNADNNDGCLDTCLDPFCGDGHTWVGMEDCDDMNMDNQDACLDTCVAASCGDGFVEAGVEECDDGNTIATDGCTDQCALPFCGDGIVREFTEQCDDGNMADDDACVECFNAFCGDGKVWVGTEECDDGNADETDACFNDCTANPDAGTTGAGSTGTGGASTGGSTTSGGSSGGGSATGTSGGSTGGTTTGLTTSMPTSGGIFTSTGSGSDPSVGCACATDVDDPPLATFLALLLAGVARPRRRFDH